MQNEMVPLPQGTTIIPSEYIIFLSSDDDKDWPGRQATWSRTGSLSHPRRAGPRDSGQKKLETKSFVIELRVDATLEQGDVRVQHSWRTPITRPAWLRDLRIYLSFQDRT